MALKRLNPTEKDEHLAFMDWVAQIPIIRDHIFHIANERKTSFSMGRNLKRMGVRPGIPDFMLPVASGQYHGLFIELKRPIKYRVSQYQIDWIIKLRQNGYAAIVAIGCDDAIRITKQYMSGDLVLPDIDTIK